VQVLAYGDGLPNARDAEVAIAQAVVDHRAATAPTPPFVAELPPRSADFQAPSVDSAWARELANVDSDGSISKESALRLFARAFGDLPGVTVEHDGQPIRSGSAAIRAVLAHWNELTPEQRSAIHAASELPADAIAFDIGPAGDGGGAPPSPTGSEPDAT